MNPVHIVGIPPMNIRLAQEVICRDMLVRDLRSHKMDGYSRTFVDSDLPGDLPISALPLARDGQSMASFTLKWSYNFMTVHRRGRNTAGDIRLRRLYAAAHSLVALVSKGRSLEAFPHRYDLLHASRVVEKLSPNMRAALDHLSDNKWSSDLETKVGLNTIDALFVREVLECDGEYYWLTNLGVVVKKILSEDVPTHRPDHIETPKDEDGARQMLNRIKALTDGTDPCKALQEIKNLLGR